MKKIYVLAVCLTAISFSCKKSTPSASSSYSMTASIDGAAKTFNTGLAAVRATQNGISILSIVGAVTAAANGETMTITIGNSTTARPITAGTYTELNTTDFVTIGEYNPGSTTFFYASGLITPPANAFTVTITSIDNNAVKGTFSGDVVYLDIATSTPGTTKKTITNGTFYAKFAN